MKKIISLAIFCLVVSGNIFGQAKEITREEYYKVYQEALKKFQDTALRRETSKDEYYREGNISSTTETITENIKPDKWRFVVIEISDKRNSKSDIIKIGEVYFCRRNDAEWVKSKSGCNNGWGKGLSGVISSQYFVEKIKENGKSFKIYRQYTIYKNPFSPNKDKEGLSYWEEKIRLSDDGIIISQESEDGLKDTKQIRSKEKRNYEYDPKDLKIEAPIK